MHPPDAPVFESLPPAELADDTKWWTIYERSFPAEEREPQEVILRSLEASVGLAFRARRAGMTVGIATTHLLSRPAAAFLVYLAVDPQHRNSRIGAAMFEFVWAVSAARLGEQGRTPLGLIWEVDPPGAAGDPAEANRRQRRISFFERQGAVLLPRPYYQPPVNGDRVVPMRLMMRPAAGLPLPDTATIESLVYAIYFEKYAAINGLANKTLQDLLSFTA